MSLSFNDLAEEKALLQKDFTELEKNVKKVEVELLQMRANLNALNGAIQQVNRLINKIEAEGEAKTKAMKEMVAKE